LEFTMNDVLAQIADRANQLNSNDLGNIQTAFQDSVAALRTAAKTKMEALTSAGHESSEFATLAIETADIAQTIEVLVKAVADVTKLNTAAAKTLDRVQKRLARYAKPAA